MNEYERQFERARLSRRQGMQEQGLNDNPSHNRIEDMLNVRQTVPAPAPAPVQVKDKNVYRSVLRRTLYIILVIVFIPLVALGGYKVFKNFEAGRDTSSSVIEKVGKLVDLPRGEEPTVATISDLAPLEGQEFFKDARIGDKVIIYKQASKAILYRPSKDKVMSVVPLK